MFLNVVELLLFLLLLIYRNTLWNLFPEAVKKNFFSALTFYALLLLVKRKSFLPSFLNSAKLSC